MELKICALNYVRSFVNQSIKKEGSLYLLIILHLSIYLRGSSKILKVFMLIIYYGEYLC